MSQLKRSIGMWGAVWMGLGSILGTGVFVSLGIASGATSALISAVIFAAFVATANGISSAQLAAAHPVSGGTYAYAYRFLNPHLGFLAGWLFLSAKSASAATAALGCSAYLLGLFGHENSTTRIVLSLFLIAFCTVASLVGMNRTAVLNAAIVLTTLLALVIFILVGAGSVEWNLAAVHVIPDGLGWLEASALAFVAYSGYGRIATLGEEVVEPEKTIPRAILTTLIFAALLYTGVVLVALLSVGSLTYHELTTQGSALQTIATGFVYPEVHYLVAIGAVTAMLGVLLNLILGLSRVLFSMGQRADMPRIFGKASGHLPKNAILCVGLVIALLSLSGDIKLTWSFSAFTLLLYYGITNFAAIRMPTELRRFPVWIAWCGLLSCLGLALFVDPAVLIVGCITTLLVIWFHRVLRSNSKA